MMKEKLTRLLHPDTEGGGVDSGATPADSEPKASPGILPIWIIIVLGLLLFWAQIYLDRHAGGFNAEVYEPFPNIAAAQKHKPLTGPELLMAIGEARYTVMCSICHQPSGMGTPGQFPPLAGSEWVTAPGPERLVRITQHGLMGPIQVKGETWNGAMPAMGAALSDDELAGVLTYIRNSWGNQASAITPEQVAAVKAETANRSTPWTADELMQVPVSENQPDQPEATAAE